jgi:hypothetical protein
MSAMEGFLFEREPGGAITDRPLLIRQTQRFQDVDPAYEAARL